MHREYRCNPFQAEQLRWGLSIVLEETADGKRVRITSSLSTRDSQRQGQVKRIEANVDKVKTASKWIQPGHHSIGIGDQILDRPIEINTKVMTEASVEWASIGVPVTTALRPSSRSISVGRRPKSQKIGDSALHDGKGNIKEG